MRRKKKSSARSEPTFMRAPWVELKGHELRCERCGRRSKVKRPAWPDEPRAQMEWVCAYNGQVEAFITQHEECGNESTDQ